MRKLIALTAVVMIAAAGIVGCGSNTAAEPSTLGPAEVVVVETPSETTVKAEGGMAAVEKAAEAKKGCRLVSTYWKTRVSSTRTVLGDAKHVWFRGYSSQIVDQISRRLEAWGLCVGWRT